MPQRTQERGVTTKRAASGRRTVETSLRIATGIDEIRTLGPLWARISEAGGLRTPFESFPHILSSARAATETNSLPLIAIHEKSDGVAALPLRTDTHLGVRRVMALTFPLAQYFDCAGVALEPCDLTALCRLLRRHFGVDALIFRKVPEGGGLWRALVTHGATMSEPAEGPYIDLVRFATFDAYDASFSNKTRRARRQRRQKLEAGYGPLSLMVLAGDQGSRVLSTALDWKVRWLNAFGQASPVLDGAAWQEALCACARSDNARLSALYAGDRLVAAELGFIARQHYVAYLGAFDPELSTMSPGQEQMMRTIAWAIKNGITRYDLLAPGDVYKRHWTREPTAINVADFTIALTGLGQSYAFARNTARPLAKRLFKAMPASLRATAKLGR